MKFYILNLIFSIVMLAGYFGFRVNVYSYLRYTKNSKTYIRKNKKGFINFWTYKCFCKDVKFVPVYYLHLAYLFTSLLYFVIAVSFSWLQAMEVAVTVLSIICGLVQAPANVFGYVITNKIYFGRSVVLFKYGKSTRGLRILDLMGAILLFLPAVLNICYCLNLFH